MKKGVYATLLFAFATFIPTIGSAQSNQRVSSADKFLISAKAGGVNFVEGSTSVTRADGTGGVLLKNDQIEIGDRVSTGSDGKLEILLNPGSYLRLGANSSMEFKSTALEDLQIKLYQGTSIFEVFATDKFRVNVATAKERLTMFDTGVYRIDVNADGSGTIAVTDGKAAFGRVSNLVLVTEGKMASFGSGPAAVTSFDKGKMDTFALWSKNRAKELSKIAASVKNAALANALTGSYRNGGWGLFDSFGLWIFDAAYGSYCFAPFGHGWRSPYGYGYGWGVYNYIPIGGHLPTRVTLANPPSTNISDLGKHTQKGPAPYTSIERQQIKNGVERRTMIGDEGSLFNRGGSDRIFQGDIGRSSTQTYSGPPASVPISAPIALPSKPGKP